MKDSISRIFKRDIDNPNSVSKFRLYLMRFYYVLAFVLLGKDAWTEIFTHQGVWNPLPAVAFSFWAAFSLLMIIGLFYPLKMIPLLLLQFLYKLVWLATVALPLYTSNQLKGSNAEGMTSVFIMGVVIDIIVIPWAYTVRNYLMKRDTVKFLAIGNREEN